MNLLKISFCSISLLLRIASVLCVVCQVEGLATNYTLPRDLEILGTAPFINGTGGDTIHATANATVSDTTNSEFDGQVPITVASSFTLAWLGLISDHEENAGGIIFNGPGTLRLNNANTYTGDTMVNAGTVSIGDSYALARGAVTFADNTNVVMNKGLSLFNPMNFNGTTSIDGDFRKHILLGALTGERETVLNINNNDVVSFLGNNTNFRGTINVNSGIVVIGDYFGMVGDNDSLGVGVVNLANNTIVSLASYPATLNNIMNFAGSTTIDNKGFRLNLGGALQGPGALTFYGAGVNTLNGANTYTGGTTINEGTLALGPKGRLSEAGTLDLIGGTFDISQMGAEELTLTGLTGVVGTTVALGDKTLVLNTVEADSIFAGNFTGEGKLVKNGAFRLTLTPSNGNNSYSEVRVNAGTVSVGHNFALGGGGQIVTFADNTTLNSVASQVLTLAGTMVFKGSTAIDGGGGLILQGNLTGDEETVLNIDTNNFIKFRGKNDAFLGTININSGRVRIEGDNDSLGVGVVNFANNNIVLSGDQSLYSVDEFPMCIVNNNSS